VTCNKQDTWSFLVIWEFVVRPGEEQRFEQIYGAEGDWAQLFRQGHGYCGTKLSRDLDVPRRYVTLDFWGSQTDYETFKVQHAAEYKAIDQKCEALTEEEREIGKFVIPEAVRDLRTGN
jgi:heme-degrading monooxygenase HmoA